MKSTNLRVSSKNYHQKAEEKIETKIEFEEKIY